MVRTQPGLVSEYTVLSLQQQRVLCTYYTMIRDAILTCARKPTRVSSIYRTKTTTKKCKTEKLKSKKRICSEVTVKVWGIHVVSHEEEKESYSGKDLQKRKVLSLECKSEWVMEN